MISGRSPAQRATISRAVTGSGSRESAPASAVPPSSSRPGCGMKYVDSEPVPVWVNQVSTPGFSTTTSCPRTGRIPASGTRWAAPSPVQLTTARAPSAASASDVTVRRSTRPPAASSRPSSQVRCAGDVQHRQPGPQPVAGRVLRLGRRPQPVHLGGPGAEPVEGVAACTPETRRAPVSSGRSSSPA